MCWRPAEARRRGRRGGDGCPGGAGRRGRRAQPVASSRRRAGPRDGRRAGTLGHGGPRDPFRSAGRARRSGGGGGGLGGRVRGGSRRRHSGRRSGRPSRSPTGARGAGGGGDRRSSAADACRRRRAASVGQPCSHVRGRQRVPHAGPRRPDRRGRHGAELAGGLRRRRRAPRATVVTPAGTASHRPAGGWGSTVPEPPEGTGGVPGAPRASRVVTGRSRPGAR